MDTGYSSNSREQTINPADLVAASQDFQYKPSDFDLFNQHFDPTCYNSTYSDTQPFPYVDSAVDLTSIKQENPLNSPPKLEPMNMDTSNKMLQATYVAEDLFNFDGPLSNENVDSNMPSPTGDDYVFSNANSPGEFLTFGPSHANSPTRTSNDINIQSFNMMPGHEWTPEMFANTELVHTPHIVESPTAQSPAAQSPAVASPTVHVFPDRTKTRAETQIKVHMVLDPLDDSYEHIHFPKKTLAKPKLFASPAEVEEIENNGSDTVYMDVTLAPATAVESSEQLERALRRARGEEPTPRRSFSVPVSELVKDDPAHPHNGGEVVICQGCKERERKRYERKKKKPEDESMWVIHDDDRVIMINDKEYTKLKNIEPGNQQYSPQAKQVDFSLRIACYCRHQEDKTPVGFRIIFTFTDWRGTCLAQHITDESFQITDDHKSKEPATAPQAYAVPAQEFAPPQMQGYQQYPSVMAPWGVQPVPMAANLPQQQHPYLTPYGWVNGYM